MRKLKRLLLFTASMFLLASCGDEPSPKLEKIGITAQPTKVEYVVGESLDTTGLEVTAYYSNKTYKIVNDYTVSGFDSSTPVESQTVTVTYKEKTDTFTVKIKPAVTAHSVIYKVNHSDDLSRIKTSSSILPSEANSGSTVSIHIEAMDGYDYLSFEPSIPEGEDPSFYDQFENYTLRESTFSFVMPACDVTINFAIDVHRNRYDVSFASVSHASFDFASGDDNPFVEDQTVHFIIQVDTGYEVDGLPFVVNDSSIAISKSTTDVYTFKMPAKAVTISVNVKESVIQTYKCTLNPPAHVSMSKHASVADLDHLEQYQTVVIIVTVESGYELVGLPYLEGDSTPVSASETAENGYVFSMPARNVTFTCQVKSSAATTYKVSFANVAHVKFQLEESTSDMYPEFAYVRFSVSIDPGYKLDGYPYASVGGPVSEMSPYTTTGTMFSFKMPGNAVTISANVVEIQSYALTLASVDHITFSKHSPSGDISSIPEGSQVTIIVTLDSGYELDGLPFIVGEETVVHKSSTVANGYYFVMPSKNATFSAKAKESTVTRYNVSFQEVPYTHWEQHTSSENPCIPGEPFMFAVTFDDGVSISGKPFIVGDSSITVTAHSIPSTYFFTMPDKDVVVSVNTTGSPRVLDHLSVTGEKTEYNVNEVFVKPTVYAHFSNSDVEEVTSSTSFTGYNLTVAGNYTVTVSYTKSGVTKTTTYDITVVDSKVPSDTVSTEKSYMLANGNYNFYYVKFNTLPSGTIPGTGYYERVWAKSDGTVTYRVNFKFTHTTENVWRIYDPEYVNGAAYDSFQNNFRLFVHPDYMDEHPDTIFYSYTNSLDVKLCNCNSSGGYNTAFYSFALSD